MTLSKIGYRLSGTKRSLSNKALAIFWLFAGIYFVVASAGSVIAEARVIIKDLCLVYGHPEPEATLERMEPKA